MVSNTERGVRGELPDEIKQALGAVNEDLGEMIESVGTEYDLTENQTLTLAMYSLQKRMKQVQEGRMYISVPVESVEFFRSPLEVLLTSADPSYAEVFDVLEPHQRDV